MREEKEKRWRDRGRFGCRIRKEEGESSEGWGEDSAAAASRLGRRLPHLGVVGEELALDLRKQEAWGIR